MTVVLLVWCRGLASIQWLFFGWVGFGRQETKTMQSNWMPPGQNVHHFCESHVTTPKALLSGARSELPETGTQK